MELHRHAIDTLVRRAIAADATMRAMDDQGDTVQAGEAAMVRAAYIDALAVAATDSSGAYQAMESWLDRHIGGDEYTSGIIADHIIHLAGQGA